MRILLALAFFMTSMAWGAESYPLKVADIPIRDPFIYVDHERQLYYLYAQNGNRSGDFEQEPRGVEVYLSRDLENWSDPRPVLTLAEDVWARKWVWAPEVFKYREKFYLFVTLTGDDDLPGLNPPDWWNPINHLLWPGANKRGTQIFHADSPEGPFQPFADKPHTPEDWLALDGTLHIEEGKPYLVFCHEWVQIIDGSVDYVELAEDLSHAVGKPVKLFNASEAPWSKPASIFLEGLITDGVFLHTTQTGKLVMIWSSFGEHGYALGQAVSSSGSIKGPWQQVEAPLFTENGGHGMLFTSLEGELMLTLHQPNSPDGAERLVLFPIDDSGDELHIKE